MNRIQVSRRSMLLGLLGASALPAAARAADKGTAKAVAAKASHAPFFTAHVYPGSPISLSERALRDQGKNVVALTFDDGPDAVNDREIMRILAEHKAFATFFVVGRRAAHGLDVLKEMIAAGHEIGNHTLDHPMLTTLSADQQLEQIRKTNEVIVQAGVTPKWFRPSYGDFDSLTLTIAKAENVETILWSVDSKDYRGKSPERLVSSVMRDIHPGAVILFHSIKKNTVLALPEILDKAAEQGYRFVTLSEWKEIMIETDSAMKLAQQQQPPTHPPLVTR